MPRKILIRAAIFLGGAGFVIGTFAFALAYFTVSIPSPKDYVNSQATIIQYSNGNEIGRIGSQNRTIVPLAKIPLNLRRAVLAAEDRNFYSQRPLVLQELRARSLTTYEVGHCKVAQQLRSNMQRLPFLRHSAVSNAR